MSVPEATQLAPILGGRWSYDPHDVLSRGSNAVTYGGKDLKSGAEIVVKVFRDSDQGRGRERFQREAELHRGLDHQAIVRLLGRGTEGRVDYIVTPRLRPGSLATVLADRQVLSPPLVRGIGIRIADALAYMHRRGEVHGDISPGNILLDGEEQAYLADFGFSKRVRSLPIATSGDAYGTEGFSAPRPLGSARTKDDDVFSLAAVLWCCLTGRPPAASERERRRELPHRRLRAPLEPALRWEDERVPTVEELAARIEQEWQAAKPDWRAAPSRPRRSWLKPIVAGASVTLVLAASGGQLLKPKPAGASQAVFSRDGLTLHLDGEWHQKSPPRVSGLRLLSSIAASTGRTTVLAGESVAGSAAMLSLSGLRSLPRSARQGQPVLVGERAALRYGPSSQFGGAVEILAIPLERSVLLVRCGGPVASLQRLCSQAAADVEPREGSPQQLAPNLATARAIREALHGFSAGRKLGRARLAAAQSKSAASRAARHLAELEGDLAGRLRALPSTGQDLEQIQGAARDAGRVAAGYRQMAAAKTAVEWHAARQSVIQREQQMVVSIERLGNLRVYPSPRRGQSSAP